MANKNNSLKFKKITNFQDLENLLLTSSPRTINFLLKNTRARKMVLKILEKYLEKNLMTDARFPKHVQEDKFYMGKALMSSINELADNIKEDKVFKVVMLKTTLPKIIQSMTNSQKAVKNFQKKYGFNPPGFLAISPGKFCNLNCIGCYANSSSSASEKLSWDVIDRIVTEKTQDWGSWFTVISGGEPFLWKSQKKTIIDLAKNHPDNFFLVYTNGTLINKRMARKIAETGNITPAISVEGFAKETNERRGKGVHKRVLQAMKNLKEVGVPFGISLTATRNNSEVITSENLIKYYWDKGAIYAWIFQLMPIGRGSFDLVITPEQRLTMFQQTQQLIKKGYFIADFWNCGSVVNGCISAGKATGGGYLYVEWNGNITPCVFNPYAVGNINEIYSRGGSLNEVLNSPFFYKIKNWQREYGLEKTPEQVGNWILPCPIRDHYQEMRDFIFETKPKPIDEEAAKALDDLQYLEKMKQYDEELKKTFDPIWDQRYRQ